MSISSLSGDAFASLSAFFWPPSSLLRSQTAPPIETGGHRQQLHWRSFELWSSYGARLALRPKVVSVLNLGDVSCLPKTRRGGKAVGIVELGGLERSICVLGPWCPHKVRWQRVSTSSSAPSPNFTYQVPWRRNGCTFAWH